MRTRGAGSSIGGIFAEAATSPTISMHHRLQPVVTSDYPTASYIENIGRRFTSDVILLIVSNETNVAAFDDTFHPVPSGGSLENKNWPAFGIWTPTRAADCADRLSANVSAPTIKRGFSSRSTDPAGPAGE